LFFYFSLLSVVKAGVPVGALVLDLGGAYDCSCVSHPVRVVEHKLWNEPLDHMIIII